MMKSRESISFDILSKYRSVLMGLTILSIIYFHFTEDCVNSQYNLHPFIVNYKQYIGSCGVDIFLFLSGLGLYYSLKKDRNKREYFRKRFSRILIPYLLVAVPAWFVRDILIEKGGFVKYMKDLLFVSFFESGHVWFWYISKRKS